MNTLDVDIRLRRGAFALTARFQAPLDSVTVLFGPSGSGKSTILSAIAGLSTLDGGHIALGPRALVDVDAGICLPPHKRGVGLIFQDARLFPHLSVRGNLAFARARAPAAHLSLDEAADLFDIGHLLMRSVRNLSGGEKGRVALARALLSAPDLLLLDEPFAALDGQRRHAFLTTLNRLHLSQNLPMVVVTHQIDDAAALGRRLVAVVNGAVVASTSLPAVAAAAPFQALLDTHDVGAALPASAVSTNRADHAAYVWVRADSVLLAIEEPRGLSARNVWAGVISDLAKEANGAVLVRVETAAGAVLSRVTAAAAADLALAPGVALWAIVKAHAL